MAEDLYKRLKVKRTATPAEITKAYRLRAKKVHPDRNPGDERAASEFRAVHLAWQVLSDDGRRARYDATGEWDETEVKNEWRMVAHVLHQVFAGLVEQLVKVGGKMEHQDLLAGLKMGLRQGQQQQQAKRRELAAKIAACEETVKRFKCPDDKPNLLSGSAIQMLGALKAASVGLEEEAEGAKKALEYLEVCGWDFVRSGFGYSNSAATSTTGGYRMFA